MLSQAGLAGLFWLFRSPALARDLRRRSRCEIRDGVVTQINLAHELTFLDAVAYRITMRVRFAMPRSCERRPRASSACAATCLRPCRTRPTTPCGFGLRQDNGAKVLIKLTASALWRPLPSYWAQRIAYGPDLEDGVQTGQIVGRLPLGGTVTVYVPATAQITVGPGVCVRAGETTLARL